MKQGKVEKEEEVEIELKRPFAAELSSFTTNRAPSPDLSSFTCRKMRLSDLEEQSKARLPREETSEENAKANGEEGVLLPFSTVLPPTSLSLLPSLLQASRYLPSDRKATHPQLYPAHIASPSALSTEMDALQRIVAEEERRRRDRPRPLCFSSDPGTFSVTSGKTSRRKQSKKVGNLLG